MRRPWDILADVRRPYNFFGISDHWDVTIHSPDVVDSRMIVMIAAYKSSVDKDRREEEERQRDHSSSSQSLLAEGYRNEDSLSALETEQ